MKKLNTIHTVLAVVTIFSFIFIGVTVLTFLNYNDVSVEDKSFVGSIVFAIGTTELVQFLSLNYLGKRRNILNAVVAGASMLLGILIMAIPMKLEVACLVWAICSIVFQISKTTNAGLNIMKQPLLNGINIILCVVEVIFCVFLIVNRSPFLTPFFTFLGIEILIKAFFLILEFVIQHYQKQ